MQLFTPLTIRYYENNSLPLFFFVRVTFLIAQLVKNPPVMQETPVQFLCLEDPLEKG